MTIAELHGKISRTGEKLHDQMEDLLTSDVFSACKYVCPATLLLPFLRTAQAPGGFESVEQLSENVEKAEYYFWPRLAHCEPDVLICLHEWNRQYSLILVEAKYLSQKSGASLGFDDLETASAPGDQLAREYTDLLNAHEYLGLSSKDIQYRCLIYLTAHRTLPEHAMLESYSEIKYFLPELPVNLFWTNWFRLAPILNRQTDTLPWELPILEDLNRLLERKQLVEFHGFNLLTPYSVFYNPIFYSTRKHPEKIRSYFSSIKLQRPDRNVDFYAKQAKVEGYSWNMLNVANLPGHYKRK